MADDACDHAAPSAQSARARAPVQHSHRNAAEGVCLCAWISSGAPGEARVAADQTCTNEVIRETLTCFVDFA
jgi:hypothetical protein